MAKDKIVPGMIPKAAVFAVLSTILPQKEAELLSGVGHSYNNKPNAFKRYGLTVKEIREKLADQPGLVSYLDVIADLVKVKNESMGDGDRESAVAAIREINKLQGYNAPQKIEVDNKIQISAAVVELKAILGTGLSADDVKKELQKRKAAVKEVEFKEVLPDMIDQLSPTKVAVLNES